MRFVSENAGDRVDRTDSSNSKFLFDREVQTDMLRATESKENLINDVFDRIENILSATFA